MLPSAVSDAFVFVGTPSVGLITYIDARAIRSTSVELTSIRYTSDNCPKGWYGGMVQLNTLVIYCRTTRMGVLFTTCFIRSSTGVSPFQLMIGINNEMTIKLMIIFRKKLAQLQDFLLIIYD